MNSNCPELLAVLSCSIGDASSTESKIATIATIYGMIMHSRNVRAAAIQRIFTTLALRYHADNKLLERLNKVHLTLSHETKRNILHDFSMYCDEKIIQQVSAGKDGKINGDNLDIFVRTNDMRMKNKNKDYHFFASDWTVDRVDVNECDDKNPVGDIALVTPECFILSNDELHLYKESLKILLGRIISQYVPEFEWMKSVIPTHIPHQLDEVMSTKSGIYWLPILLKNEASYSDCIQIMASYEQQICKWYTTAGRGHEVDELRVPVGGDQLTRVRLQGAKSLRAGSFTQQDRLEHLFPVICEMFHTLQDFLEKLYKRFFDTTSGRDLGTLYQLKLLIQRSNVNGNVKSRFEAHEDFVLTVGCAYILSFLMKFFNMKSLKDLPTHCLLKKNMKMMHNKDKERIFSSIMNEILQQLFESYPKANEMDKPVAVRVTVDGTATDMEIQVVDGIISFMLDIGGKQYRINVPAKDADAGLNFIFKTTNENVSKITVNIVKKETDDLHSYVCQFMQWYFMVLSFKDTVREGDIYRNNVNLKFLIPFFFSHSVLSKYMAECIDYILKTEIMLTEKMAMRVRAASFVNVYGKQGENKPADLQKENQVMVLKELINGLGANKTEESIITISKAAPIIQAVANNFDSMLCIKRKRTRHKKRSFEGDVGVLVQFLSSLNIWEEKEGRKLRSFHNFSKSPFSFSSQNFKTTVLDTVTRLRRDLPVLDGDDESETSDNE